MPDDVLPVPLTELRDRLGQRLAFVVMQFASTPWDLFELVKDALASQRDPKSGQTYHALRADDVAEQHSPAHIWTLMRECDLIVVDVSNRNVNVYMELGAALAYGDNQNRQLRSVPVACIGERTVVEDKLRPFDLIGLPISTYEVSSDREATARSVTTAVGKAVKVALRKATIESTLPAQINVDLADRMVVGREILLQLPSEVTGVLHDPAASVLATRYIQILGRMVGAQLAAPPGFPELPDECFDQDSQKPTDELVLGPNPACPLHGAARDAAVIAVAALVENQQSRDNWTGRAPDVPKMGEVDRRLTFVGALLNKSQNRSSAEVEVLAAVLGEIALSADDGPDYPEFWETGIRAIRQLTRMRAISVTPSAVATIPRLQARIPPQWGILQGDRLSKPHLTLRRTQQLEAEFADAESAAPSLIATLGGAYYLGHNIALIRDHDSPYAKDALEMADSALPGRVIVPGSASDPRVEKRKWVADADIQGYEKGLRAVAPAFVAEHPFHLRVLLELLSGENRRYAAECVLTSEGLRCIWSGAELWTRFTWCRDQLPVVANVLVPAVAGQPRRAFVQDYVAFGRTPHTSSFMRLDYTAADAEVDEKSWWPKDLAGVGSLKVENLPRSVAEGLALIERQRRLGRIWRGAAKSEDRDWISGAALAWNPEDTTEHRLVQLVQHPSEWPDQCFTDSVVTELVVGRWIVDALAQWVLAPKEPKDVRQQAQLVLRIVLMFANRYLNGSDDDGVPGLQRSLQEASTQIDSGVARLEDFRLEIKRLVSALEASVSAASSAAHHQLDGPTP